MFISYRLRYVTDQVLTRLKIDVKNQRLKKKKVDLLTVNEVLNKMNFTYELKIINLFILYIFYGRPYELNLKEG